MYRVIFGEGDAASNSALQVWNGVSLTAITGIPFSYPNPLAPAFPTYPVPQYMVTLGSAVYFMLAEPIAPYLALFKSDGASAGLAANVALPQGLTSLGGVLYFAGYVGTPTPQTTAIWAFDGSTASVVVEFNATGNMQPTFLTPFKSGLAFTADDGAHGREAWFWDGKLLTLVGDINAGAASANSSYFTRLGNILYFAADDGVHGRQLWAWDGATAAMAVNLATIPGGANPVALTNFNGALYFFASSDTVVATNDAYVTYASSLWRWDGQTASALVSFGANTPGELTVVGSKLYFTVDDGVHGRELWAWDGSQAALVADIAPGSADANPRSLKEVGGNLYFFADDGVHGVQPWRHDGSAATMLGSLSASKDWSSVLSGALIAGFGHPTVSSIGFVVGTDGVLNAMVTFDAPVQVSGTPSITLAVDGQTILAGYVGGSGGQSLTFATVPAAVSGALVTVSSTVVSANGGVIADQDGNAADLTFTPLALQVSTSLLGTAYTIGGSAGDDRLSGYAGNDILTGGAGNDAIDGAGGMDAATYSGSRNNYVVARAGNSYAVQANTGTDGNDTLSNIERLKFSDETLALDIAGNAGQAYRIYQAAFDRKPDNVGLKYWISAMDGGGALDLIASGFIVSTEFTTRYGASPSHRQFISQLYGNVLHRTPDQSGHDYWVNLLDSGQIGKAQALVNFSESNENQLTVIGVIQNGIDLFN